MAVDCAVLDAVSQAAQPPTLRLYGWDPFCLSLGYGQRIRDVDLQQLSAKGWHLVRRPTGGKAILHGDELTYSLCLPLDHPLAARAESLAVIGRSAALFFMHCGIWVCRCAPNNKLPATITWRQDPSALKCPRIMKLHSTVESWSAALRCVARLPYCSMAQSL